MKALILGRRKNEALLPPFPVFVRELRAFSFPLSVLPVLVGVAAAVPCRRWRVPLLAAEVLGVVFLHGLGNVLNDYFDFASGVDRAGAADAGRPGRLLVRGVISPAQVRAEAWCLFGVFLACAAYIVAAAGPGVLGFAAAGLFGAWAYTGPPFRLKARALGELSLFFLFGPALMAGAAYVQSGRIESPVLWLSLPFGAGAAAVLAGNNLRDWQEDRRGNVRTLAHFWGRRAQMGFYFTLLGGVALGLAGIGAFYGGRLWLLAGAAAAVGLPAGTFRRLWRGRRVADVDVQTARALALAYALAWAALVWNGGLR